jgi:hypothetical protein
VKYCYKGFFLFVILALIFPGHTLRASGKSETRTGTSAGAEEKSEFPQWAKDLRRADIITFGAFPLTFFLGGIVVDTYRASQHGWDTRYGPWPVNMGGSVSRTTDEQIATICVAAGGAVLVAVADYIIQRVKRERDARYAALTAPSDPIIIRNPWPPGEESEAPPEAAAPEDGSSGDGISGNPPGGAP